MDSILAGSYRGKDTTIKLVLVFLWTIKYNLTQVGNSHKNSRRLDG